MEHQAKMERMNKNMKKRILSAILTLCMVCALLPTALAANTSFRDVSPKDYYYDAVNWAVENNITAGTSATTFSPNKTCSRAEIVQFLYAMAGKPAVTGVKSSFIDVDEDDWFYTAVMWAYKNAVTSGTTGMTFSPDAECTRAQVAQFLSNYYSRIEKMDVTADPRVLSSAMDLTSVPSYAVNAMAWTFANGIIAGTSTVGVTLSPNAACTRAQIVQMLYNSVKSLKEGVTADYVRAKACYSDHSYSDHQANQTPAMYSLCVLKYEGNTATIYVEYMGNNGSPLYCTRPITVQVTENKASFDWEDSWGNQGTGQVEFYKSYIKLYMKQTVSAAYNRYSLATSDDGSVLPYSFTLDDKTCNTLLNPQF